MKSLSKLPEGIIWLNQVNAEDRPTLSQWLDSLTLVTANEIRTKLNNKIRSQANLKEGPVGLYIEREVRVWNGVSQRAFHEKKLKKATLSNVTIRAYGKAAMLRPVAPKSTVNPEIGSEGLLATLATQLCKENPEKFYLHPGPDLIREKKIASIFILTDFIGSGKRACSVLDSFWRHATVKSWRSSKLTEIWVIAYASTYSGRLTVEQHPSKPTVRFVRPCPTVDTEFSLRDASVLKDLFIKYDPVNKDPVESLGFGGDGAMIIFAHGCPNNAPRILFKSGTKSRPWKALFIGRSNLFDWGPEPYKHDHVQRFHLLGLSPSSSAMLQRATNAEGQIRILVLAAIKAKWKHTEAIASKCALDIDLVESAIVEMQKFGWLDIRRHLTDNGNLQLSAAALEKSNKTSKLAPLRDLLYYPRQLRRPM